MNPNLRSRLLNWKFSAAEQYLVGEPPSVVSLVTALSDTFGSPGWGLEGHMATIVDAALRSIGTFDEEDAGAAQQEEQRTRNAQVGGSIPPAGSVDSKETT